METIGWAALQIIPSMRNVDREMTSQLVGPARQSGQAAGRAAGEGMASGLEAAQASVAKASGKVAAARDKEADAAGKVRVAEAKLQELRDKGNASASQLAAAEERLATAQRNSDRAASARVQAVDDLAQARARAANAADEGESSTRRWGASIDGMGDKLKSGTDDLGKFAIAAAGIGSAIGLGMQAFDNMDVESRLAASLGATGDLAAQYGDMAGSLWKQGLAGSMDEAAAAVEVVATSFVTAGSEGERSIDQISESALNFSKVFGTDVNEAVQTASQLVTNGLAKDSTEAFDLMTTSFQRVPGAMRDELPEILNEYGTNFRALGFDGQESFNILVSAASQGKFALDKTGDALKEFTIRATDGSKSTADAYKFLGEDVDSMATSVAAGGESAQLALQYTAQKLLEIEDPAVMAQQAIALFGTPLEDLSVDQIPKFLQSLTGAEDQMAGFAGSSEQMGETLNSGPNHAMTELKNTIQGELMDTLGSIASWMIDNQGATQAMGVAIGVVAAALISAKVAATGYAIVQGVMAAASGAGAAGLAAGSLSAGAYSIAVGISTAATWAFNAAMAVLTSPITLIILAVAALVGGLIWFFTQTEIGQKIVTAAWDAILAGWNWLWDKVSVGIDAFGNALGWIGEKAGQAKDWVVEKFNELVGFVTGLPGRIGSAASGLWDGITNAFKSAINWIIQKWNNFRLSFDFTIPIINKKISLSLDTPDLPLLRDGGTIAGRTADGELWGPGTGRSDSILGVNELGLPVVRVADGEGVVREDVMRQGGAAVVAALNAGWVPSTEFLHALMNGDFRANPFGIEEDSGLVAGALGLRSLAIDGDYTPNLRDVLGIEEDNPIIGTILSLRDTMSRLPKFADGGVIGSLQDLARENFPALQMTDGIRPGANDYHGAGKAADFSNGSGNTDEQLGFANFLADHYQGQLLELIYDDPRFDRQIKNGEIVPGSFYANAGDHTHHVHAAADEPLGPPAPPTPEVVQVGSAPSGAVPGWGPNGAGASGATTTTMTPKTELQQTFSARDRWKSMFTDIAGVWSDASIEILGVGEYLDMADRYTIKAATSTSAGMTSGGLPQSMSQMPGADAPASVTESLIDPNAKAAGHGGRTGADLYAFEIARAAHERGLGEAAAAIGEATALVESGDPLKMWANNAVPESLNFPHDAVGSDYDSVGLFQQRDNGAWGTVAQRMDPFESALMFFDQFPDGWQSMDPGAVAQSVQRSAFPDRYGQKMSRAQELVDETGLFDTGGWMMPGQLGFNGLNDPEPVLLPRHWDIAEANIAKVDELVGAGVSGGGPRVQIINNNNQTIADQASWQYDQANRQRIAIMRFGGGRG